MIHALDLDEEEHPDGFKLTVGALKEKAKPAESNGHPTANNDGHDDDDVVQIIEGPIDLVRDTNGGDSASNVSMD